MKLKTTTTQETEIEVISPLFKCKISSFSAIKEYRALIDNTYIEIFASDDFSLVKHTEPEMNSNSIKAMLEWQDISEAAFLYAHESALKALSLTPVLTDPDDLKEVNI